MATVHAQVATSHEAAGVAEQEDGCTTVLLWPGETTKHVLLRPLIAAIREVDEELLNHGSNDVSGRDGVDTNVVLAPLSGEVTAQLDDGGLTGVVGGANETLIELKVSPGHQAVTRKRRAERNKGK